MQQRVLLDVTRAHHAVSADELCVASKFMTVKYFLHERAAGYSLRKVDVEIERLKVMRTEIDTGTRQKTQWEISR